MQASQQLNELKFVRRASFRQRLIAGFVFLAVVALLASFWLASTERINTDRLFEPCGFKQWCDLPCPTCGMTTSILAFVRGQFFRSFYIQPTAALLCCILVVTAFLAFPIAVFGVYFGFLKRFFAEVKIRHVILAIIIIVVAGWAVTLARAINGV
ncbi:MAG: DUF2752 domain-containing protein [Planctomycetota bacterium]|jgi:hypothetical protein